MKEKALFTLLLLFFVGYWNSATAQVPGTDVVTLKDGKILKGKILRYTPGQTLQLEQADGQTVELADTDIAKIQQGLAITAEEVKNLPTKKLNELPTAKTRGIYATSMLSFAVGSSDPEGLALGAGFSQVVGYQTNQWLGLGCGFGVDNYSRGGETVYPIFAEVRSFLPSKSKTGNFYLSAAGGYALAFERKSLDITNAEGGPMGHFALGYRAATAEGLDIYVDLGAKFQRAHFERRLYNGDTEFRDIDFKRIVIRVGIGLWK